jgi:plasmid stabilization system protein ParE
MPRELVFNQKAIQDFKSIQIYISYKFGEDAGERFENDLLKKIDFIAVSPALYPVFQKLKTGNRHKCVFKRKTIILFRYNSKKLFIDAIKDARSNWQSIELN